MSDNNEHARNLKEVLDNCSAWLVQLIWSEQGKLSSCSTKTKEVK